MLRVQYFRKQKGMSQAGLSAVSGVSQSVISDIENGVVSPTVKVLTKLAKGLEVSVAELLPSQSDQNSA